MVSSQEKPHNYPLYSVHFDLDSFILYNDENINEQVVGEEEYHKREQSDQMEIVQHKYKTEPFWNMSFDGSCVIFGSGVGVWVWNTENNYT